MQEKFGRTEALTTWHVAPSEFLSRAPHAKHNRKSFDSAWRKKRTALRSE